MITHVQTGSFYSKNLTCNQRMICSEPLCQKYKRNVLIKISYLKVRINKMNGKIMPDMVCMGAIKYEQTYVTIRP